MKPRRALFATVAALFALPVVALLAAAAVSPLPPELRREKAQPSVRVVDRGGRLIRELRTPDHELEARVALDDVSPWVVPALLAAEDLRFFSHPGVDVLAVTRAAAQAAYERKIVSGASTLTQQLARTLVPRPRTLVGKFREMALALRIEASLSKHEILEEYLNRVEFGPNLRGIEAASRAYFDKPASQLELGEAATLAAMPRGPALYDPSRGQARIERRRARVLDRMERAGLAPSEALAVARSLPLRLSRPFAEGGAPHFVRALVSGTLEPSLRDQTGLASIQATLDADLQREIATLAAAAQPELERIGASAASIVVLDNQSGDVLAYVGSPDFMSQSALGQNDGVRARRQPGSTLKPFVYALAMRDLGLTPASLLPDVEISFPTADGAYVPRNYDRRFHGPVTLRAALANSLNVPAVHTTSRLGPERVLGLLHELGFASLDQPAQHYGVALALGDGEVTLLELASAYATLARGGSAIAPRFATSAALADGRRLVFEPGVPKQVLPARIAALVTHVLADDRARAAAFGRGSVLSLPFPAAAKTGTSKGFRDNWVLGYTREVTVGVWVGNFDGRSMLGSTGINGAGPLFRDAMLAAMRGRAPAPLVDETGLSPARICAHSGELASAHCPEVTRELFLPGSEPHGSCPLHGGASSESGSGDPAPRVVHPRSGARFVLDGDYRAPQIALRAQGASSLELVLDGRVIARGPSPLDVAWPLSPGAHSLIARAPDGSASPPVTFVVAGSPAELD